MDLITDITAEVTEDTVIDTNPQQYYPMNNVFNTYLLPIQIVSGTIEEFDRDALLEWIYDYKERNPKNDTRSNRGGYQNVDKSFFNNDPTFVPHFDILKRAITSLAAEYRLIRQVYIQSAWININHKYCYNNTHKHPGSNLSGVLWVKIPENSGTFVFEAPATYDLEIPEHTNVQYRNQIKLHGAYEIPPREGMMILFPSYLEHYVTMNESDEDRVSIAFNLGFI